MHMIYHEEMETYLIDVGNIPLGVLLYPNKWRCQQSLSQAILLILFAIPTIVYPMISFQFSLH